MSATITIIVIGAIDPDAFESIALGDRKRESRGWETFELRSGRYLCTFLMKATKADLGVFGCADEKDPDTKGPLRTRLITQNTVVDVLPILAELVEKNAASTALALQKHGGGKAELARIAAALSDGTWPESGDPAEEAAAFAHHLLSRARKAKEKQKGVCWEYRGKVKV